MTINDYLKAHPELDYTYTANHKDPRRRQAVKVYFSLKKDHPGEQAIPTICKEKNLPYSLIPIKGNRYYIYITPHIYE